MTQVSLYLKGGTGGSGNDGSVGKAFELSSVQPTTGTTAVQFTATFTLTNCNSTMSAPTRVTDPVLAGDPMEETLNLSISYPTIAIAISDAGGTSVVSFSSQAGGRDYEETSSGNTVTMTPAFAPRADLLDETFTINITWTHSNEDSFQYKWDPRMKTTVTGDGVGNSDGD